MSVTEPSSMHSSRLCCCFLFRYWISSTAGCLPHLPACRYPWAPPWCPRCRRKCRLELMQRHTAVFRNDALVAFRYRTGRRKSCSGFVRSRWYGGTPCLVPTDAADRRHLPVFWAADAVPVVRSSCFPPYRGDDFPSIFYSISHFGSKSKVLSENHSQIIFARSFTKNAKHGIIVISFCR